MTPFGMDADKRRAQVLDHLVEGPLDGRTGSAHKDIVPARLSLGTQNGPGDLAKATLRAVTDNSVAHLPRTGEADARRFGRVGAITGLKKERRHTLLAPPGRPKEVSANLYDGKPRTRSQPVARVCIKRRHHGPRPKAVRPASGRQLLAALRATRSKDKTSALGCHAGTKPVTTGTNQVRGLKRALHRETPSHRHGRLRNRRSARIEDRPLRSTRAQVNSPDPRRRKISERPPPWRLFQRPGLVNGSVQCGVIPLLHSATARQGDA